jgi:hypothetical protein
MLDKNAISIGIRVGSAVRVRQSWRSPHAGRLGVVLAIEPNDPYGAYIIGFEDGLHFRYQCQELEPAESTYLDKPAVRKFCRLARLLLPRHLLLVVKSSPTIKKRSAP